MKWQVFGTFCTKSVLYCDIIPKQNLLLAAVSKVSRLLGVHCLSVYISVCRPVSQEEGWSRGFTEIWGNTIFVRTQPKLFEKGFTLLQIFK